ncbi:MAG: TRIC cation channel family protein [Sedimenticola sp.]
MHNFSRGIQAGQFANMGSSGALPSFDHLWNSARSSLAGILIFLILTFIALRLSPQSLRDAADMAATFVFAFTGGLVTAARVGHYSLLRQVAVVLAGGFLTANGGGTARTFILQQPQFFWLENPDYLLVTFAGGVIAWLMAADIREVTESHWDMADRIALGVFAGMGAEKAGLVFMVATGDWFVTGVLLATLTGAGGGLIRDLLLRRWPTALFTSYGLCAAVGGALHLHMVVEGVPVAWFFSTVFTTVLACLTRKWSWRPKSRKPFIE